MHRFQSVLVVLLIVGFASQAGCEEVSRVLRESWHEKFSWKAKDYFKDPKVIALCEALEANNLEEIDRLVAAGADVNAKGKGNMTPLLWAYPDNKPERFKRILEHGADPNVIFESDFNTRMSGIVPGDSVTHMVCGTWFPKYFDYVFQHGGDPNLWHRKTHRTPIFHLIMGPARNKQKKLQRLIDLEANLDANKNYDYTGGQTPVMVATSAFGQYELALQLLKAGADYKIYTTNTNMRLIHVVVGEERRLPYISAEQKKSYYRLMEWLEDHGETVEDARADIKRWQSWSLSSGEYRRKMDAEIAARKAREAKEREEAAAAEKKRKKAKGTPDGS